MHSYIITVLILYCVRYVISWFILLFTEAETVLQNEQDVHVGPTEPKIIKLEKDHNENLLTFYPMNSSLSLSHTKFYYQHACTWLFPTVIVENKWILLFE